MTDKRIPHGDGLSLKIAGGSRLWQWQCRHGGKFFTVTFGSEVAKPGRFALDKTQKRTRPPRRGWPCMAT